MEIIMWVEGEFPDEVLTSTGAAQGDLLDPLLFSSHG